MALRGTLTHRKTRHLAALLDIYPPLALGILEAMWSITAERLPRGDIGRLNNKAIAMEIFYGGDADALVAALVEAEWLDKSEEHRLIVHDWHEHSDDTTDARLARAHLTYASGHEPRGRKLSKAERMSLAAHNGAQRRTAAPEAEGRRTEQHNGALPVPVPVPVPVPGPVPEPKVKTLPAGKRQAEPEQDERHVACRSLVHAYWHHRHPAEQSAPWDGSEAKALTRLLKAKPDLTPERFRQLLACRERSEVNHDERPRAWLERLTDYAGGPLDRFKQPSPVPVLQPGMRVRTAEEAEREEAESERGRLQNEAAIARWAAMTPEEHDAAKAAADAELEASEVAYEAKLLAKRREFRLTSADACWLEHRALKVRAREAAAASRHGPSPQPADHEAELAQAAHG